MNAMEEKILERQAGFEEGEEFGAEKSELAAIVNLMKNKGWTVEEIMDAMGIAEEKRNRYMEKLKSMD